MLGIDFDVIVLARSVSVMRGGVAVPVTHIRKADFEDGQLSYRDGLFVFQCGNETPTIFPREDMQYTLGRIVTPAPAQPAPTAKGGK